MAPAGPAFALALVHVFPRHQLKGVVRAHLGAQLLPALLNGWIGPAGQVLPGFVAALPGLLQAHFGIGAQA